MLGRNHILSACSGWLIAEPYLIGYQPSYSDMAVLMAAVSLGALLPDIDHPGSLLGRRLKFISVPLQLLQGDRNILPWLESTHSRGITHSFWMLIGCWWLFNNSIPVVVALSFGFIAHLIGDALTPAGIRLFWPLPYKVRSPISFETGGVVEHLFTLLLAVVAVQCWMVGGWSLWIEKVLDYV